MAVPDVMAEPEVMSEPEVTTEGDLTAGENHYLRFALPLPTVQDWA